MRRSTLRSAGFEEIERRAFLVWGESMLDLVLFFFATMAVAGELVGWPRIFKVFFGDN